MSKLLTSPRLTEFQKKIVTDNIGEDKRSPSGFLRITFTAVWIGLLVQLCSETSIAFGRLVAFGVYWALIFGTIALATAAISGSFILFVHKQLEKGSKFYWTEKAKEYHYFMLQLLAFERPQPGRLLAFINNVMLIVCLTLTGWSFAAAWVAVIVFAAWWFTYRIRQISFDYFASLTPEKMAQLNGRHE